ncbi:multidrug resistance efflux transporter family protein [Halalkalibacter alkaliphilus]|uniref:Multidrug resistance efflux transporter family protein n=1 Tax=Halalkalibacter alkaliphilus TaxID=2917993 RepID=A0A9X2I6K3_9BACI|nr:multidrug resistance efflux transporter family protein [Halalkalibacter alkaliphilus]MCL7748957.1 multidrug resistance efflux transporter family protein [Halalkalibacter alkaliphilus]
MKEITLGLFAAMFFAVTFILNRSMELAGGSWMWSSSLRFLFMLPFLFLIVLFRNNVKQIIVEIKKQPIPWFAWSFVGFVLFYAPITFAAAYGPGWLVAGTWQLVIVAGTLLAPLFLESVQTNKGIQKVRQKIPFGAFCISLMILFGVALMQLQNANGVSMQTAMIGVLPVMFAAVAYPLGNRKMMEVCGGRLDTFQRVFGMTLVTIPFWLVLSLVAFIQVGAPSSDQILQSFIVAISSGVIATTLFFIATDRVRGNQKKLAAVEATQSTQVLFVLMGEIALLSTPLPNGMAMIGMSLIVIGMFMHSYFTKKMKTKQPPLTRLRKEQSV